VEYQVLQFHKYNLRHVACDRIMYCTGRAHRCIINPVFAHLPITMYAVGVAKVILALSVSELDLRCYNIASHIQPK